MNIYEPLHQISSWVDNYRDEGCLNVSPSTILDVQDKIDTLSEDMSHGGVAGVSNGYNHEAPRSVDRVQRRLAQNREAARKSRLRKKAYVQQLEISRTKMKQIEQELEQLRPQAVQGGHACGEVNQASYSGAVNPGIVAFEMEYGNWVEKQNKQICELRNALNTHTTDTELRILVDTEMKHYIDLFQLKASAARIDVFYLMSGMWKTPAERFFFWIGGFRPSELIKVLGPQLDPLTDQQVMNVCNLKQSCEQAEEALSQGIEKLQQILADSVAEDIYVEGSYKPPITDAFDRLESLMSFVNQADHLRRETLQQMCRILTIRQTAKALLVLGEYFHRLRALSSLWSSRKHD